MHVDLKKECWISISVFKLLNVLKYALSYGIRLILIYCVFKIYPTFSMEQIEFGGLRELDCYNLKSEIKFFS